MHITLSFKNGLPKDSLITLAVAALITEQKISIACPKSLKGADISLARIDHEQAQQQINLIHRNELHAQDRIELF